MIQKADKSIPLDGWNIFKGDDFIATISWLEYSERYSLYEYMRNQLIKACNRASEDHVVQTSTVEINDQVGEQHKFSFKPSQKFQKILKDLDNYRRDYQLLEATGPIPEHWSIEKHFSDRDMLATVAAQYRGKQK